MTVERIPHPPFLTEALKGFPITVIEAGTDLWRVHRVVHGPWFFGQSGRFGLDAPYGSCYVAMDPMSAISETVVRGLTILHEHDLNDRCIHQLSLLHRVIVANLKDSAAAGFGVTRNFGTEEPYDRTREWARAFFRMNLEGIHYWPRYDLVDGSASVALFGTAGERKSWRRGRCSSLSAKQWRQRIQNDLGVTILGLPRDADLDFVIP